MRLDDRVWGALLALLAIALLVHVRTFPPIPGQRFGAWLFPFLIACGLGACGLLLIVKGTLAREPGRPLAALDPWTRSPRHVVAFALVVGVNVAYIAFVDKLGFVLAGTAYLALLFWIFGVRGRWILPIAIVVTLLIHYAFYKLLRVPLPWGVLQRFAW